MYGMANTTPFFNEHQTGEIADELDIDARTCSRLKPMIVEKYVGNDVSIV
jgi:hypothetical protein